MRHTHNVWIALASYLPLRSFQSFHEVNQPIFFFSFMMSQAQSYFFWNIVLKLQEHTRALYVIINAPSFQYSFFHFKFLNFEIGPMTPGGSVSEPGPLGPPGLTCIFRMISRTSPMSVSSSFRRSSRFWHFFLSLEFSSCKTKKAQSHHFYSDSPTTWASWQNVSHNFKAP